MYNAKNIENIERLSKIKYRIQMDMVRPTAVKGWMIWFNPKLC